MGRMKELAMTTIVAYTYQAEMLCPSCTMDKVQANHRYFAASTYDDAELFLAEAAEYLGIDHEDERSFDSGDFPKVVFADQVEAHEEWTPGADDIDGYRWVSERCDSCGEELI